MWDLDSGDTAPGANEQKSIDFYKGLANEGVNSKHLPLSHEVWKYAVDAALNHTVDALHTADITLLTVAECLDIAAYEFVGKYGERDDTWTCDGSWAPPSAPGPSISASSPSSLPPTITTSSCTRTQGNHTFNPTQTPVIQRDNRYRLGGGGEGL